MKIQLKGPPSSPGFCRSWSTPAGGRFAESAPPRRRCMVEEVVHLNRAGAGSPPCTSRSPASCSWRKHSGDRWGYRQPNRGNVVRPLLSPYYGSRVAVVVVGHCRVNRKAIEIGFLGSVERTHGAIELELVHVHG